MIDRERAEKLFVQMRTLDDCELSSKELDALQMALTSSVVIKAFRRAFLFCQVQAEQMLNIDMGKPESVIEFSQIQGRIQGVNLLVEGLLRLITEEEENEDGE